MKARRAFLVLIVFIGGMTTMGVEMAASRLLDPYFGNSLIIWANLIGLILIYLTVGYYLGGRLADRSPHEHTLYKVTAWAAFLIGLVPIVARPILQLATRGFAEYSVGLLLGSLFGVILLFAVPVTLLGFVSPFAIRLAVQDVKSAGNIAGKMYAVSTLGSIVGTFAPVLLLIPNLGTRQTLFLFSLVLLGFSALGLIRTARTRSWLYVAMFVMILLLAALVPAGVVKATAGLVFEDESAYNYIQVVKWGDDVYLKLNEGQGVHSVYNQYEELTGGIWDLFLLAPFFNNPPFQAGQVQSLCLIGSAAGTVSKEYTLVFGAIPIDGVEIDPRIIQAGRRFFEMNEPNLNAVAQDGRYYLASSPRKYDVVAIDAYRPPYIPFHLTTREFFQQVSDHLNDNGVVAINAGRTATDYSLVNAMASTVRAVFPNVYVIDIPNERSDLSNSLVIGTKQRTRVENLERNVALMTDSRLLAVAERARGMTSEFTKQGIVFTDDRAPVEQVVHGLILRFVTGR